MPSFLGLAMTNETVIPAQNGTTERSDPYLRISLTPTKNESWIIKPFLAAARCWASHVVVADQGSPDGTLEILQSTPGVDLVLNESPVFDETHRQRLLINRAREIPGEKILFGLDADEALSANCAQTEDWQRIMAAKPGTILRFRWANILPGFKQAWIPQTRVSVGFIDDGSPHEGRRIHSPRVPNPAGAPTLDLDNIFVLHFQYVLCARVACKQRWYQAWEHIQHKQKGPLQIYREYNHMNGSWGKDEILPVKEEWLAGYDRRGIDFRALTCEPVTWWDKEIVRLLREHGPQAFRKIALWDQDWNKVSAQLALADVDLSDPRSIGEKAAHRLLAMTQSRRGNLSVRVLERFLRMSGW
jgi:hypothetical protein